MNKPGRTVRSSAWQPLVLTNPSLELAVAWGAAYYAFLRHTGGNPDNRMVLDSAQGGSLTGRSTHDQGRGAFLELTATKPFERRDVEIARIAERRRKRGCVAR